MPTLDCGIDIGTTNVKVVLVDEWGRAVATRSEPSPRVADGAAVATDAMALVELLERLIVGAWYEAGGRVPLRSIATAGIGEDGIGVTADLVPTGLALPWFDKRAAHEADALQRSRHATPHSGHAVSTERTAAKWLWLHRHRPAELSSARWWIALTDFPAVWWSGVPFMSVSLAPRTGCFDVLGRSWIEPLLEASHAPPLPALLNGGTVVGGVRIGSLRASGAVSPGTLIVAGGHDHPVAASVLRRLDPNARVDSLGTANLVYGETESLLQPHLDPHLAFSLPPNGAQGIACLGVVEFSAAMEDFRRDTEFFQSVLRQESFADFGARPVSTLVRRHPEGVAKIRHALEETSLRARDMFRAMNGVGVPRGPIYMTGGWSRSRALAELRASVFGEPIHIVGDIELSATGAALFASEAATGRVVPIAGHLRVNRIEPVMDWTEDYAQRSAR